MSDHRLAHYEYQYAIYGYRLCDRLGMVHEETPGLGTIAWYWQEYMT